MSKVKKKRKKAKRKAHLTEMDSLLFTKYKLTQYGWRYFDLQSNRACSSPSIIDLIAFKIDELDDLKIILFHVKEEYTKNKKKKTQRLRKAREKIEVAVNWAEKTEDSVIFDWEPTEENFNFRAKKIN